MIVPGYIVIGDSLPFALRNLKRERDSQPMPSATCSYELLDARTRAVVTSGSMTLFDAAEAAFEAVILESNLASLVHKREYVLRATAVLGQTRTTKSLTLIALREPPLN